MSERRSIRVIVLDDQEVVRIGLRSFFVQSEVKILAESASHIDLQSLCGIHQPDVVIAEIQLGNEFMFDPLQGLKNDFPLVHCLLYSVSDNPTHFARAVVAGVDDYVLKTAPLSALLESLRRLSSAEVPYQADTMQKTRSLLQKKNLPERYDLPLTQREIQILRHLAFGLSNKEIARSLVLSVETIKEHVQNLLRKLSLRDRTQAAVWAVRQKLV